MNPYDKYQMLNNRLRQYEEALRKENLQHEMRVRAIEAEARVRLAQAREADNVRAQENNRRTQHLFDWDLAARRQQLLARLEQIRTRQPRKTSSGRKTSNKVKLETLRRTLKEQLSKIKDPRVFEHLGPYIDVLGNRNTQKFDKVISWDPPRQSKLKTQIVIHPDKIQPQLQYNDAALAKLVLNQITKLSAAYS
eukprot:6695790-Pyramimonas_sp.AAC.1